MAASDQISLGIGSPAGIRGFILFGLSAAASSPSAAQFTFTDQSGVAVSTTGVQSAGVVLTITNGPAAISVSGDTGAKYSINGGAATASAGTVSTGDTIYAYVNSSASYLTSTNATVTVADKSDTFTVTTRTTPGGSSGSHSHPVHGGGMLMFS